MKAIVTAACIAFRLASAQQPDAGPRPVFEVASVKPTDLSLNQAMDMKALPGGAVTATAVPLKFLITVAYNVQNIQVSGGPGWIETDRFDLLAKPPDVKSGDAQTPSLRAMLQSLLEDRFHLVVHHETRDQTVYEMVAKKPGQLGPNLKPSALGGCPAQPGTRSTTPCGGFLLLDGKLTGQRVTIGALSAPLSRIVGRPVIDSSGIPANFDITLEWTPDSRSSSASPGDPPSMFTAIEEELGLKLQPAKKPMEMLVIEHAEKPSEN